MGKVCTRQRPHPEDPGRGGAEVTAGRGDYAQAAVTEWVRMWAMASLPGTPVRLR